MKFSQSAGGDNGVREHKASAWAVAPGPPAGSTQLCSDRAVLWQRRRPGLAGLGGTWPACCAPSKWRQKSAA